MTEIPEHLLKRAAAAREQGQGRDAGASPPRRATAVDSRIPEHLLQRSKAAKDRTAGDEAPAGGGVAVAEKVGAVVAAAPAGGGVPVGAGPGGHTQRLLTVVKSGSIQEVKATPVDKVHTWPHLLSAEFVAALLCTAFTFIFSIFVHAPLLRLANLNETPNPSKAPWYFLGLAGAADDVPPDGGRRHLAGRGPDRPRSSRRTWTVILPTSRRTGSSPPR